MWQEGRSFTMTKDLMYYANAFQKLVLKSNIRTYAEYARGYYNLAMCTSHKVDKQKYMQLVKKYTDLGRKLQCEIEILDKVFEGEQNNY